MLIEAQTHTAQVEQRLRETEAKLAIQERELEHAKSTVAEFMTILHPQKFNGKEVDVQGLYLKQVSLILENDMYKDALSKNQKHRDAMRRALEGLRNELKCKNRLHDAQEQRWRKFIERKNEEIELGERPMEWRTE